MTARGAGVVPRGYPARMVRLTKIYTKVGDGGQTMLGDGVMVPKHARRVEAYGTVDEANAAIGVAVARFKEHAGASAPSGGVCAGVVAELVRIQNDLFDVGADLCVPIVPGEDQTKKLRVIPGQTSRLESVIDRLNEPLAALTSFVLPGGAVLAADLHLARTITRRAERAVSALLVDEPVRTNPEALVYLNRLSDLLFVMARAVNSTHAGGGGDVLWVPGGNR